MVGTGHFSIAENRLRLPLILIPGRLAGIFGAEKFPGLPFKKLLFWHPTQQKSVVIFPVTLPIFLIIGKIGIHIFIPCPLIPSSKLQEMAGSQSAGEKFRLRRCRIEVFSPVIGS